jgi:hypothetical protein
VIELLQPRLDVVSMKNLVKIKMQHVLQKKKELVIVVEDKGIILLTAMLREILKAII